VWERCPVLVNLAKNIVYGISDNTCRPSKVQYWVLIRSNSAGSQQAARWYDPLKTAPALYRVFVDLDTSDRGAIQAFANEYGFIGVTCFPVVRARNRPLTGGELFQDWTRHVADMRAAVEVWDMRKDEKALRKVLAPLIRPGPVEWVYNMPKWELEARGLQPGGGRLVQSSPLVKLSRHDPILPAKLLVLTWLSKHLKDHTHAIVQRDISSGELVLRIWAKTLLGAMWLQFAREVAGMTSYRRCPVCKKWFQVMLEESARGARKVFCTNACKQRDARERKERAIELAGRHIPIREVAKTIDTPQDTVARWLKSRRRQ
jgi:hypothetical protein